MLFKPIQLSLNRRLLGLLCGRELAVYFCREAFRTKALLLNFGVIFLLLCDGIVNQLIAIYKITIFVAITFGNRRSELDNLRHNFLITLVLVGCKRNIFTMLIYATCESIVLVTKRLNLLLVVTIRVRLFLN